MYGSSEIFGGLHSTGPKSLYRVNFTLVIQSISRALSDWRHLPLSISGKIAVIKTILFPKVSYVLQMIPLLPSKSNLANLRTTFSNFIWQGKRPRVTYTKLILPRDKGGYSLPDVSIFSQTILFRQILDWLLRHSSFSNYDLEEVLFLPFSPSALLHLPRNAILQNVSTNVLFMGTYNSWFSINKRLRRNSTESEFNTFWGNPSFPPGMDNSHYRT